MKSLIIVSSKSIWQCGRNGFSAGVAALSLLRLLLLQESVSGTCLSRKREIRNSHTYTPRAQRGSGGQRRPEADRIGQYEKNSQETREAAKKVAKTTTHTYFFHSGENLCENFPCENQCVCLYTFYVAHIFFARNFVG